MDHHQLELSAKVPPLAPSTHASISLTAVLLVGGASRRMGSDKALLRCPTGEPLWSRQLKVLRDLQPRHTWISARTLPAWCPAGIEVILDTPPSRGPLSGICPCLARLETTHLLVMAIDMPCMTTDHLRNLCRLAQSGRGVIPRNDRRFEPLCAIYSKSCETLAAACLAAADYSLQSLAQAQVQQQLATPHALSAADVPLYLNVNRPEDFPAETITDPG